MTQGRPLPLIIRFTVPVLLGNLFQQLYNAADTLIVGRFLGSDALAAVGSTGTLMFLLLGIANGLTTGFSMQIAQTYGAKEYDHMRRAAANAVWLSVFVTVIITAVSVLFMHPLLRVMNTPAEIYKDAYSYIIVIGWGAAASVFYNLFSAVLRAVGNSRAPLYFLIFSSVLNVALDILFIAAFHMGTMGAALATVLSQAIAAVLSMFYIRTRAGQLWAKKGEWKLNREDTLFQLKIGIPMALQYGITASGNMVKQSALNTFGADAVAATTASGKVQQLLAPGLFSMGQTMATWSGQNYGRKDFKRIRQGVRTSILIVLIYSALTGIASVLLVRPIMWIFFGNSEKMGMLIHYARIYLNTCVPFFFVLGVIFILRSVLQGCGSAVIPTVGGIMEFSGRLLVTMAAMAVTSYTLACFCDPAAWLLCGAELLAGYLWLIKREGKRVCVSDK